MSPRTSARLLLCSLLGSLLYIVLLPAGTATAAPCVPVPGVPCPSPTATPTEDPSPTPSATATRPAPSPASIPTRPATRTPGPQITWSPVPGSTDNPITSTIGVGGAVPGTPAPVESVVAEEAGGTASDKLTTLLVLVLGAALLLGIGGGTGIYLTRHPHAH